MRVCSSEEKIKDIFELTDIGLMELDKTAFAAGDGGKALILNAKKFCEISAGCLKLTGAAFRRAAFGTNPVHEGFLTAAAP